MGDNEDVGSENAFAQIVETGLADLPDEVASAIRLSSVVKWFDLPLLTWLLNDAALAERVEAIVAELQWARRDEAGRWRYLHEIRDYLREWSRQFLPTSFLEWNRRAFGFFQDSASPNPDRFAPVWLDLLYHLLQTDEQAGLILLRERVEDALIYTLPGLAESFVSRANEIYGELSKEGQGWITYYQARLNRDSLREDRGAAALEALSWSDFPLLAAFAGWTLGELRIEQQRWTEASRLLRRSRRILRPSGLPKYLALVESAQANVYADLAERSGGLSPAIRHHAGRTGHLLQDLIRLPLILYRWLVRFVPFLPNWYFGDDYQDWVIADLLKQSAAWYRRSIRTFRRVKAAEMHPDYAQAQLSLASIEHQLGRWRWTQRRFASILEMPIVALSRYRTAKVLSAQGRALLGEKKPKAATPLLERALDELQKFDDPANIGVTAMALGAGYAELGATARSLDAYSTAWKAFVQAGDLLAQTELAHLLETRWLHSATSSPVLSDEERRRVVALAEGVPTRAYLARFPTRLLRYFRTLTLYWALPLNYLLSFIPLFLLMIVFFIIEGEIRLLFRNPNLFDISSTVLLLSAPVGIIWACYWLYCLLGYFLTGLLDRWLTPIEQEQPHIVLIGPDRIGLHASVLPENQAIQLPWGDVSAIQRRDYTVAGRILPLFSRTRVSGPLREIVISGVTYHYRLAQEYAARRMPAEAPAPSRDSQTFEVLEVRWLISVILIAFGLAFVDLKPGSWGDRQSTVLVYFPVFVLQFLNGFWSLFPITLIGRLLRRRFAEPKRADPTRFVATWVLIGAMLLQSIVLIIFLAYRFGWTDF